MLEVDLEYHDKLRGLQNNYPLAPEKRNIGRGMLSGVLQHCSTSI